MTTLREAAQQALEALWQGVKLLNYRGGTVECLPLHDAITALRAALAQQAEPVPTHRINSWGFCGVCRHDRIPGEGCARQECPDSPQQAEPVDTDCHTQGICQRSGYGIGKQADPQIEDRLARHGIPKP